MDSIEFLRPRLRGDRFADGAIPLEIFGDLIALHQMVIQVAGWRYRQLHPDRRQLPRGFAKSVDLKLAGVERGSAVPVITMSPAAPARDGAEPPQLQAFAMARDDIIKAIGDAGQNGYAATANGHLPRHFLASFNRVGRSLRDGECMEFPTPERAEPVRLTPEIRERLLQSADISDPEPPPIVLEPTQEITVRGVIYEVDQDRMTFELQPVYGDKVSGPIPEQHRAAIIAAFCGYRDNVRVLIRGSGSYDRQGRVAGIAAVEHIATLDPLDVPARLDELRAMQDGWLDGEGLAPSHAGLDWLSGALERHLPGEAPLPYAFPTPDGGIQLEWPLGRRDASLEIDLTTHQAEWHWADLDSDDDAEAELNLDDAAGWEWLGAEIIRLEQLAQ